MKPIPALKAVHPTEEFLVYKVDSFTDPNKQYRVDLALWDGWGACGCEHFSTRIGPLLAKGDWSTAYTDKHLISVHLYRSVVDAQRQIKERQGGKRYDRSEPNV